jgi:bacterioferritin (cytochrome b1)
MKGDLQVITHLPAQLKNELTVVGVNYPGRRPE